MHKHDTSTLGNATRSLERAVNLLDGLLRDNLYNDSSFKLNAVEDLSRLEKALDRVNKEIENNKGDLK